MARIQAASDLRLVGKTDEEARQIAKMDAAAARIAALEARIERLRAVARKADVVLHDMTEGERDGLYGEELERALYSLQPGDLED
jgi:hypothetical protein